MDYLDRKKEQRHRAILLVGYVFVAIAIAMTTVILLYQAYGFGVNRNGTVIQSGLLYLSSQPQPAKIYLGSTLRSETTNTRLLLPSNIYNVRLSRTGYYDWQRRIDLEGGQVLHFDYPFLFPTKLQTTKQQTYSAAPGFASQSPDHRWIVLQQPSSFTSFELRDIKAKTPVVTQINLPDGLLSSASSSQSLQALEWADDNQHLLLQHTYDGKTEFILLDRANPDRSVNLNKTLASDPSKITLNNKKYDQYYLYQASTAILQTASLSDTTPKTVLQHVLSYQSYGNKTILYATDDAPKGKVLIKLSQGDKQYTLRSFPAGTTYLQDLTEYNGTLYVVTGAVSENKVYIYKDPLGQLSQQPKHALVPVQVLHVPTPNYVGFSNTAQFIVVENGQQFGVYDIFNQVGHNYSTKQALDAPQVHATWMDGNRLVYTSGGKLIVFDYDGTNQHILMPNNANYLAFFAPNYKYVDNLAPTTSNGSVDMTQTSLLTAADQ